MYTFPFHSQLWFYSFIFTLFVCPYSNSDSLPLSQFHVVLVCHVQRILWTASLWEVDYRAIQCGGCGLILTIICRCCCCHSIVFPLSMHLQLFTASAPFTFGFFEQDLSAEGRLANPHLYRPLQAGKGFNPWASVPEPLMTSSVCLSSCVFHRCSGSGLVFRCITPSSSSLVSTWWFLKVHKWHSIISALVMCMLCVYLQRFLLAMARWWVCGTWGTQSTR